jgi:peptide-methionine (S)-S-oxide reductase
MAHLPLRTVLNCLAAIVVAGLFAFVYFYTPSTAMHAATSPVASTTPAPQKKGPPPANLETAVFGTGCFWCSQAVFERLDGVWEATCGYMGGTVANPTYQLVCTETTGHAEVTMVKFDPKVISYEQLLEWFWHMHDPTTLNRQGADVGTSYRSAIFYYSDAQKAAAEKSKAAAQKNFKDPIVTEITKAGPFYKAEDYHQEYFNNNSNQGYCRLIIAPKLDKLKLPETPTTAGNGTAK